MLRHKPIGACAVVAAIVAALIVDMQGGSAAGANPDQTSLLSVGTSLRYDCESRWNSYSEYIVGKHNSDQRFIEYSSKNVCG